MAKKGYAEGGEVRKQGVIEKASRAMGKVLGEKDPTATPPPKAAPTGLGSANKGNAEARKEAGMKHGGKVKRR